MLNRRVLVTGSDGFIGSHVVEELIDRGYAVKALVMYNSIGSIGWLSDLSDQVRDKLEVVSGDIRDQGLIESLVKGCDFVIHLAALIAIPHSYVAAQSYIDTNVSGTLNLLHAAKAAGVRRFVHVSTSEVYGSAITVPITESHKLQPQSPYAASKIAADSLVLSYHKSFDLPVVIVRPFNTFGPRQSARAVIPSILAQAIKGGSELHLGDLSPTRDFTYVKDTADGLIKGLEAGEECLGEVINLGTGFDFSIRRVVELCGEVCDKKLYPLTDRARYRPTASEVMRLNSDNSKALEILGWSPSMVGEDGLRRGLELTHAWLTNRIGDFRLSYDPSRFYT